MMNANISIFVPHVGCKRMCSFCNQFTITSQSDLPHSKDVDDAVKIAVESGKERCARSEIAFFGGSFTAIDREYMIELLSAAYKYVKNGTVSGIRCSTRPDEIDKERLDILKSFGVTTIELGAQSMDDEVLRLNNRGHSSDDVRNASRMIKEYGFSLGLQMMTGLYGSSFEKDIQTAKEIIGLGPDCVRIYPTITLKNTYLGRLYLNGRFKGNSLEESVELCSKLLMMFYDKNIPVIRLGLHAIDEKEYLDGPWHPAFGELCESRIYRNLIDKAVSGEGKYFAQCNPREISKVVGQKKCNLEYFLGKSIIIKVEPNENVEKYKVIVRRV